MAAREAMMRGGAAKGGRGGGLEMAEAGRRRVGRCGMEDPVGRKEEQGELAGKGEREKRRSWRGSASAMAR